MPQTDAEFLAAFQAREIPAAEWTHRAHVRCAYLHARTMPLPAALDALRSGIKALNAAHGLVETPERGYHETLTHAWLKVIDATVRSRGAGENFEAFAQEHPHLLHRTLLRLYYSPSGMPPKARYEFVPPDLSPLPS